MAKLRSRQSTPQSSTAQAQRGRASQKTTPQQAPQANRRSTRQQSQQLSSANSSPEKQRAAAVAVSAIEANDSARQSLDSASEQSGKLRRVNRRSQKLQEVLDTVVEEGQAQDALKRDNVVGRRSTQSLRSPGGRSDLSGTTAITSFTVTALTGLGEKREDLIRSLADLCDYSSTILRSLAPAGLSDGELQDVLDELRRADSGLMKRVSRAQVSFVEVFNEFVTPPGHFIRRDHVVCAMLGREAMDEIPDDSWRPDDILSKANLAAAIFSLVQGGYRDPQYLQVLDTSFPQQFLGSLQRKTKSTGDSNLVDETFEAALTLRSQLAIVRLKAEVESGEPFDPIDTLLSIFWNSEAEETDWPGRSAINLKGWGIEKFEKSGGSLYKKYADQVLERANSIHNYFNVEESEPEVDLDGLTTEFPDGAFLQTMLQWATLRNIELTADINVKGGPDEIAKMLKSQEVAALSATKITPALMGVNGAMELAKIMETLGVAKTSGSTTRRSLTFADTHPKRPVVTEGDRRRSPSVIEVGASSRRARSQPAAHRSPAKVGFASASRTPKKRLTDPQANAGRVSPINSQSEPRRRGRQSQIQSQPSADVVSDDEGFASQEETSKAMQRAVAEHKRRNAKALQERTSSALNTSNGKRRREAENEDENEEDDDYEQENGEEQNRDELDSESNSDDDAPRPRKRARISQQPVTDVEEDDPVPIPDSPPPSNYPRINQQAKLKTTRSNVERAPQRRKPWSADEIQWFVYYIENYGISWSHIKAIDKDRHLADRDQVGLKDKARNMKFDYLMNGVQMPKNMDKVAMPKNLLTRLEARGIDIGA